MLFLRLKKVQIVKITLSHIPTNQQKNKPAKFPIAPTGEMPLLLNMGNTILLYTITPMVLLEKPWIAHLHQKKLFRENISITFVYLLFSIMLKCFIKDP